MAVDGGSLGDTSYKQHHWNESLGSPHTLTDTGATPSGDVERSVRIRRDFVDLEICTREKLAHVRECKTGTNFRFLVFS